MIKHLISVDPKGPHGAAYQAQRLVSELQRLGAAAKVQTLHVGDVAWAVEHERTGEFTSVTVEMKTIPDFLASLPPDERLPRFVQETGGAAKDPHVIRAVLLSGRLPEDMPSHGRPWSEEAIDNMLVSLQNLGVRVLRCRSKAHVPQRLKAFWDYTGRDDAGQTLLVPVVPRVADWYSAPRDKLLVRHLMTIPGIGEERARALLQEFKSPLGVYAAARDGSMESFKRVKGVGKGLVYEIRKFITSEVSDDFAQDD